MRRIFERFMNTMNVLMMLFAVGSVFNLIFKKGDTELFGVTFPAVLLILFFNYVILGKLTLWHRQDSNGE